MLVIYLFTHSLVCLKSCLIYNIEKTIMKHILVILVIVIGESSAEVIEFFNLFCKWQINDFIWALLFEHDFFSSWLIFEYLLKRHLALILKFLSFPWLLSETWLPSMVLSQHFQIQHFLSLIDRRHFFPSYWVRHIRERQTGCRRKFNQVEVICNRF